MSVHILCYAIWMYSLIMLLTIGGGQLSTKSQKYYSETNEIITYGVSVLRTIVQHREGDGNLINLLRNITINNSEIQELMDRSPSTILDRYSCKRHRGLEYLNKVFQDIDNEYNDFEKYLQHMNDTNHKFPPHIVSIHEAGFLDVYAQISLTWINITHPMDNPELFEALVDRYNPMVESNCTIVQSLNQYIYDLYNKILSEIIKVYSIIMYYRTHVSIEKNHNHRANVLTDIINDFEIHVLRVTDNVLKAMGRSPRYVLQRDPKDHKKGATYESFDYFLQRYVADPKYSTENKECLPICSEYNNTVHYNHTVGKSSNSSKFSQHSICTGRIRFCMNSAVKKLYMTPSNSTHRYKGDSNNRTNGKSLEYWGRKPEYYLVFPIALYSRQCRICSCTCDTVDSPNTIRYVDLRTRRSDSYAAFVITGIRFRIINRVLYLQIQEGVLQNGKIIPETVTWKKIDHTDRDHDNDTQLFKIDYDNRLFDLTYLTLPDNYVVTMIAFTNIDGIISLFIEGLDMIGGEMDVSQLKKLSNRSSETLRFKTVFKQDGLDLPTFVNITNNKISELNKFLLRFETSDWGNSVGQNVVPFIDLQDVVTDPPAPIAGIGMHVRYGGNSGGFLAPKLISINNEMKVVHKDIRETVSSLRLNIEMKRQAASNRQPDPPIKIKAATDGPSGDQVFSQWGG